MKRTLKSFLALTVLVSAAPAFAAVPTFIPRSQSVNAAREMVGWQQFINLCDMDCTYGAFSITPEFTSSFRSGRLAQCLFGTSACCNDNDCGAAIKVSGSTVQGRAATDWLADYFGLPTDFQSTLTFNPRIRNFLVDLNLYLGLDELACGMYFRVHAPIVHTRWNLRFCENVTAKGVNDHLTGYFNVDTVAPTVPTCTFNGVPRANLLNSASEFFSGARAPNLGFGAEGQAVTFQKLAASKFSLDGCDCKGLNRTRLSDIEFALGWNFWCCEDYLVGLSIRASAPTGNKPCDEFFFAPLVGDGHHWKLGGGLNAQTIFWRSDCDDRSFGFFLDARVQHLFKACQNRVFDLCGKPNSRYMLAQRLGTFVTTNHLTGASGAPGVEFRNEFAPVANLTRSNVDVEIAVEGDVALKFAYMSSCWEWDLGYEFWGRSCEKFCRRTGCGTDALADGATWALKGDAMVFGFTNEGTNCDSPVPLAATQSLATINAGRNGFTGPGQQDPLTPLASRPTSNPGIDTPVLAVAVDGTVFNDPINSTQTRTSVPPVFLSEASLDLSGTKGITHKIFANVSYAWTECEDWTPFLGIGGEVEFAQSDCNDNCGTSCGTNSCCPTTSTTTTTTSTSCCTTSCDTSCGSNSNSCCQRCALSQWGVWVKGGIAFN